MGTTTFTLAGALPDARTAALYPWLVRLATLRDNECPSARATTYYVSTSGNNANNGLSPATAVATPAQVNALCGGSSNVRVRGRRGDVWRQPAAGFLLTGNNVTLDWYSDGTAGHTLADPLPRLTMFQAAYGTSGWTLSSGKTNTYQRAETGAVGWLREENDAEVGYVKADSIANVEANEGSFYWAANVLYLHARHHANPASAVVRFEVALNNTIHGLEAAGDNVRVEGWTVEGFGTGTTVANQHWNLFYTGAGTSVCYVKGCEFYYGATHSAGHDGSGAGGILTFDRCLFGWLTDPGGLSHAVGYNALGGQEIFVHHCRSKGGVLKTIGSNYVAGGGLTPAAQGVVTYAHTGGGGIKLALAISWANEITPGQYQEDSIDAFNDVPVCQDATTGEMDFTAVRALIVDAKFPVRKRTGLDETMSSVLQAVGKFQGSAHHLWVNCAYTMKTINSPVGGDMLSGQAPDGVWINPVVTYDFEGFQGDGFTAGFQSPTAVTHRWYNPTVQFRIGDKQSTALCYLSGANLYPCLGKVLNGVFTIHGKTFATSDTQWAYNNNPANAANNAFCGLTENHKTDTIGGWDHDPYYVELPSLTSLIPDANSPLISANTQLAGGRRLEYDALWRPRATNSARGAFESDRAPTGGPAALAAFGYGFNF